MCIENFLKKKRKIRVELNDILSLVTEIQNGIAQLSILRVTLFLLVINDIINNIQVLVKALSFADDLTLICKGKI